MCACVCDVHVCGVCVHAGVPVDNRRYTCLQFTAKEAITMHGFAGYFDTTLYDNITLSEFRVRIVLHSHLRSVVGACMNYNKSTRMYHIAAKFEAQNFRGFTIL